MTLMICGCSVLAQLDQYVSRRKLPQWKSKSVFAEKNVLVSRTLPNAVMEIQKPMLKARILLKQLLAEVYDHCHCQQRWQRLALLLAVYVSILKLYRLSLEFLSCAECGKLTFLCILSV